MNKFLKATALVALFLIYATNSYGQFFEGTKTIGGGLGFTSTQVARPSGNDTGMGSFNLNLNGGLLVQDNIEAGLRVAYSASSSVNKTATGESKNNSNLFAIGPYARLYNPITDVVGLFGQAGLSVGFGGDSNDAKVRTFDLGISPGVILMVNENLGLEVMVGHLGYSQRTSGDKDNFQDSKIRQSAFNFKLDLSDVNFGFRLYLRN